MHGLNLRHLKDDLFYVSDQKLNDTEDKHVYALKPFQNVNCVSGQHGHFNLILLV